MSVHDLATAHFRSDDYTYKLFRRSFGESPYEYVLRRRMDSARFLLRNTGFTVGEIAAQTGYSDVHYFCRLFKTSTGMTPTEYREADEISNRH